VKKTAVFIFLLKGLFSYGQNITVIDSLLSRLVSAKDTGKVNLFNQLAYEYRNSELNKTDSFASLAIELSSKENFQKGLGNAYVNKGFVSRMAGDYPKAVQTYRVAMVYFVQAGYKPGFSTVYNNIASVYYLQGNYVKAQYYYFQALNISEELHDKVGVARTLNNIGAVYMEQSEFTKAVAYFMKAYTILEERDPNQAADCLNNIGTVYQYLGDTVRAIKNYRKSMEINKKLGDRNDVSSILNNIGYMYSESGNYKLALDHFFESLDIDEEMGDVRGMSACYGNITHCYYRLSMLHAADKYATLMLDIAKRYNIKTDIIDAYKYLDSIEEANGNYKLALAYTKQARAYNDSVNNEKSREAQSQLELMYQKEKADKEKLISSKEDEMKSFRSREKEKEIAHYILLIGMVLLLFILVIYVVFFLLRRNKYS
jgi:tetratricopeptide (TPR) repeat protein